MKDKRESYKFYQNHSCQFFPCHDDFSEEEFSCLFCYCPLYHMNNCGGDYTILNNNIKDCSECKLPHKEENYEYIIKKLMEENNGSKQRKS
ncbi:MAG: cysteine-rich small domain-containing protein [Clostridiales bacterium]|nr:cysteine-rich small domain-containing protein [Clostridiales bacterium]